jgi:predicted enzyme related to lactoylglutathione lyase
VACRRRPRAARHLVAGGRRTRGPRRPARALRPLDDARDARALDARLRDDGLAVEGPVEHEGGDRFYFSDPEGNRVELWDFFRDGDGDDAGVDALAQEPDAR